MWILCKTFANTSIIFEIQCDDGEHIPLLLSIVPRFKALNIHVALDNVLNASLVDAFEPSMIDYVKVHGDIICETSYWMKQQGLHVTLS